MPDLRQCREACLGHGAIVNSARMSACRPTFDGEESMPLALAQIRNTDLPIPADWECSVSRRGSADNPIRRTGATAMKWCAFAALLMTGAGLFAPGLCDAESVAITFDDLPLNGILAPGTTRVQVVHEVLAVLKERRAPQVVGFVNASKLEGSVDGAAALTLWVSAGERVGNHTYSHVDLHEVTPADFLMDVRRNEPALELLDQNDSWRWFRFPYLREGNTLEKRRAVREDLRERGYRIAQVTQDYEDYLWNSAYARCLGKGDRQSINWLRSTYLTTASQYLDVNRQMAKLLFGRDISHVLLLHLGAFSATILPDLLDLISKKGFTLVTLEEAQSDAAYEADPDAASRYGGSLLEQLMDARGLPYPTIAKKPYKELEVVCQ
jgi:peptidoglycan/xylan/chitin deacetylase (PgdA/CDA1 family)